MVYHLLAHIHKDTTCEANIMQTRDWYIYEPGQKPHLQVQTEMVPVGSRMNRRPGPVPGAWFDPALHSTPTPGRVVVDAGAAQRAAPRRSVLRPRAFAAAGGPRLHCEA